MEVRLAVKRSPVVSAPWTRRVDSDVSFSDLGGLNIFENSYLKATST